MARTGALTGMDGAVPTLSAVCNAAGDPALAIRASFVVV